MNDAARFRCTECGDCCRRHRVPVTAADLLRLTQHTGQPAAELVDWLEPERVEMTGEPESFVMLPQGKRLPVLAHHDDACRFLTADDRCSVYEARPACCRTFPLELSPERDSPRRLVLLDGAECPGTFDGPDAAAHALEQLELRCTELERHLALIHEWNRQQRRRRWAGRALQGREALLTYLVTSGIRG